MNVFLDYKAFVYNALGCLISVSIYVLLLKRGELTLKVETQSKGNND